MAMTRRFRALLRLFFRRRDVEADLDEEVQSFYQIQESRYREQGMSEQEARRMAHLRFGHQELVKEQVRDVRAGALLASAARDVRLAVRKIANNPSFALVTILTLALGIGANATIFSIVSRFLLHHPPVGDPGSLIALYTTHDGDRCCNQFTWPLFADLREQARSFSGLTAYYELLPASIGGSGEPERVWGQAVTANFFDIAQLPMARGRGFAADEEDREVIVIGYRLWQRRFGGDPAITGKTVRLSGRMFTIVGVAPQHFRGLDFVLDCAFWVPLGNIDRLLPKTSNYTSRSYHWIAVDGRLRPGVTSTQAAAELAVLARHLAEAHPESEKGGGFRLEPAGSLPPRDKATLLFFMAGLAAVALLVFAIACFNVANLSLAQASARRREMAVRLALGATRTRLLCQLLTENLLLALSGGLLGVLLSFCATRGLAAFRIPAPVPLDILVEVDWRVLLYVFVLSAGAGVLFGLAPAWAAARPKIAGGLRGEDILGRAGSFWSLRNALAIAQIAMSLMLLCATGLFLRSLNNAVHIDIGFRSRGLLMVSIDPRLHGYSPERTVQFLTLVRQRVAALPNVLSVVCTDAVPLSGGHRSDGFQVEGRVNTGRQNNVVDLYMATAGYFDTLAIARKAGPDFADAGAGAERIAAVNEVFVQTLFPHENPIGKRVRDGSRVYRIIAVVANIKSRTIGEDPRPVLFRSLAQDIADDPSETGYTLIVRYARDPGRVAFDVREAIHALDPALAVFHVETMEEHLRDALFLPRLAGALFGVFGFIGLTLAAVGLYGVMSYWVSRRTREIGIRMAVGADTRDVERLIMGHGVRLSAIASLLGLAGAWALTRLFSSFLYGVPVHDATTFSVTPLFLAAVALLACWIPSRRAARVDPSVTLRHE